MIWLLRMRDEHRGTWHALNVDREAIDCELCMQTSTFAPRALCGARPSDGETWHNAAAGAYIADSVCSTCIRRTTAPVWEDV